MYTVHTNKIHMVYCPKIAVLDCLGRLFNFFLYCYNRFRCNNESHEWLPESHEWLPRMELPSRSASYTASSSPAFHWLITFNRRRGRVGKGVGHLAHVWSYSAREVVSSNPDRGNIVGWVFHPTRWLARFSLIDYAFPSKFRIYLEHCPRGERPSALLIYEVASHVKKLPFRPILLLL